MVLKLLSNKLHIFGFTEHLGSCDLDKNTWSNEQNHMVTHWDSFVSIYLLTCFATFKAKNDIKCDGGNNKRCHVMLYVLV